VSLFIFLRKKEPKFEDSDAVTTKCQCYNLFVSLSLTLMALSVTSYWGEGSVSFTSLLRQLVFVKINIFFQHKMQWSEPVITRRSIVLLSPSVRIPCHHSLLQNKLSCLSLGKYFQACLETEHNWVVYYLLSKHEPTRVEHLAVLATNIRQGSRDKRSILLCEDVIDKGIKSFIRLFWTVNWFSNKIGQFEAAQVGYYYSDCFMFK